MHFKDLLAEYITKCDVTLNELAEATGISTASISRYRNGTRIPGINSPQLERLAQGISQYTNIDATILISEFKEALSYDLNTIDYEGFSIRFNSLLNQLSVKPARLASFVNYDTSYISLVRNNKRRPSDLYQFADSVCEYIVLHHNSEEDFTIIKEIVNASDEQMKDPAEQINLLKNWLLSSNSDSELSPKSEIKITSFLEKLDEFDLDEYIRAIHFDTIKVPSVPFQLPTSKTYFGLEEMKKAEIDFLKSTVLNPSITNIYMYSDMGMEDMACDKEFSKKWMAGLAMALKKGHHIHIIHNIDRPLNEMIIGLEAWIPLYMTGQVHPYYLPYKNSDVFCHLYYYSETACCHGQCIEGHHEDGLYYISRVPKDLEYFKKETKALFDKAEPFMNIYNANQDKEFFEYFNRLLQRKGVWQTMGYHLPEYTMEPDLLDALLKYHHIDSSDSLQIYEIIQKQTKTIQEALNETMIYEEFPLL